MILIGCGKAAKPRAEAPLSGVSILQRTNPVNKGGFNHPSEKKHSGLRLQDSLLKEYFLGMLDKTLPRDNAASFDLGLSEPSVHLLIFVHRVSGMDPGLYFFVRDEGHLEEIKLRCRTDFRWEKFDAISRPVGFYLLKRGDFRNEGAKAG